MSELIPKSTLFIHYLSFDYFLCLSSGFLVNTKYKTYNQLKIPCKKASKTDLFLSQETTTAKTLPNPIPLLIAVFFISLFIEFWLKHSKENIIKKIVELLVPE